MKQKRRGSSMKWEAKQKESACGGNCAGAAAARGFWLKWRWRTLVKLTTTSTIQTTAWRRRRRLTITPSFQRCISGMNRMIHVILLKNTRKRTHIKYEKQKRLDKVHAWLTIFSSCTDWPSLFALEKRKGRDLCSNWRTFPSLIIWM